MGGVTLECKDLSKAFGAVLAIDDLDISFSGGSITALVGPNGAGKTTLFHLVSGFIQADEGSVLLRGEELNGLPPWKIARRGIGRLFQDVRVFGRLTARENILVALGHRESPLDSLFHRREAQAHEQSSLATHLLERVELAGYSDTLAASLSFGQQKLLAIARVLASGADVLLLDEPTSGLGPMLVNQLLALLKELARQGKTLVVIEHNMPVVLEVADWTCFMDQGRVASFGLPEEVLHDPHIRARYLGL